jgi:tetratricopeptide (TPR) repeat protein
MFVALSQSERTRSSNAEVAMRILRLAFVLLLGSALLLAQTPSPKPSAAEIKTMNAQIAAINDLLAQINGATQAKDWQKAKDLAGNALALDAEISTQHPGVSYPSNRHLLYKALGDSDLYLGQYQDAVNAYETSMGLLRNLIRVNSGDAPDATSTATALLRTLGQVVTNEGNAYLKLHKNTEAIECYRHAAETASAIDPKMAATAWFNLCATLYNMGDTDGTPAACDKAIAADPTRANAYFVKGSTLFAQGKDVNGKFVAVPESIAALNKYLELAPDGPHAAEVKQMLQFAASGK